MSSIDLREAKSGPAIRAGLPGTNFPPSPKRLRVERRQHPVEAILEESLSSALLASDRELGHIVREVDEISQTLKTHAPDTQSLRVAQHPAVWNAVKQALLERELRHLDLTDDLTGLFNRRGFFAAATQLLNLSRRKAQAALLLYCDIENLKLINNSLGQGEGDLALIRAADALERTFRNADVLARIGGDEFVVLILEASKEVQGVVLDRLEKNLRQSGGGNGRYSISLKLGASWFDPKHAVSLGELMSQAERALGEKKHKLQSFELVPSAHMEDRNNL